MEKLIADAGSLGAFAILFALYIVFTEFRRAVEIKNGRANGIYVSKNIETILENIEQAIRENTHTVQQLCNKLDRMNERTKAGV